MMSPRLRPEAVPEMDKPQRMITWADILDCPMPRAEPEKKKKEMPLALSDAIAGITGRHPPVIPSNSAGSCQVPGIRLPEILAAVEAFIEEEPAR